MSAVVAAARQRKDINSMTFRRKQGEKRKEERAVCPLCFEEKKDYRRWNVPYAIKARFRSLPPHQRPYRLGVMTTVHVRWEARSRRISSDKTNRRRRSTKILAICLVPFCLPRKETLATHQIYFNKWPRGYHFASVGSG